jgi:hypothetical protein
MEMDYITKVFTVGLEYTYDPKYVINPQFMTYIGKEGNFFIFMPELVNPR